MNDRDKMIKALRDFRAAYYALNEAWQTFDLDNLYIDAEYPFTASFDELLIADWCDALLEEIESED